MRQDQTAVKGAHACERHVSPIANWRDCASVHAARTKRAVSSRLRGASASLAVALRAKAGVISAEVVMRRHMRLPVAHAGCR
jgi:hypothetical protein